MNNKEEQPAYSNIDNRIPMYKNNDNQAIYNTKDYKDDKDSIETNNSKNKTHETHHQISKANYHKSKTNIKENKNKKHSHHIKKHKHSFVSEKKANNKKFKKEENKFLAIILNLLGYLSFTTIIFSHRFISLNYPHLTSDLQNLSRGVVSFSISIFAVYYNGITLSDCLSKVSICDSRIFFFRVISGGITPFFLTGMGNNLRLSTSLTLTNLLPIVISVTATYFLNEIFSIEDLICLILCLIGCLMITKPFGNSASNQDINTIDSLNTTSQVGSLNNTDSITINSISKNNAGSNVSHQKISEDSLIGLVFAGLSLTSRTIAFITQKIVGEQVELIVLQVFVMGTNTILSVIKFMFFSEVDSNLPNLNQIGSLGELFWLGMIGLMTWITSIFLMMSFCYAPLIFLQPIASSSILFSFIMSWLFLNESYDIYDYNGALLIFLVNIIRSLHAYGMYLNKIKNSKSQKLIEMSDLEIIKEDENEYTNNNSNDEKDENKYKIGYGFIIDIGGESSSYKNDTLFNKDNTHITQEGLKVYYNK